MLSSKILKDVCLSTVRRCVAKGGGWLREIGGCGNKNRWVDKEDGWLREMGSVNCWLRELGG